MTLSAPMFLRGCAVAIAVAGVADPVFSIRQPTPGPLAVVAVGDDARSDAASMHTRWASSRPATLGHHALGQRSAACPEAGDCILVSAGQTPARLTAGARVRGVVLLDTSSKTIASVSGPERVHRHAAARVTVELATPSRVDVFDDDQLVGSAEAAASGPVDVTWVPVQSGARRLRLVAGGERADIGVVVDDEPLGVVFHEPLPSWQGTFVRRALQSDPRLSVSGQARIAPAILVRRGAPTPLRQEVLQSTRVVVVSAPNQLSAAEVDLLESFVRVRGGRLVALLDERPTGAVRRLLPAIASERREATATVAGPFRVREFLTFEPAFATSVLTTSAAGAVVVARALGRGQVIASGALDAWRFRDAAFREFWSSLVVEAARDAGAPLHVEFVRSLVAPGEEVQVSVVQQTLTPPRLDAVVSAHATCGAERTFVRLWPAGAPGRFEGVARFDAPGPCELTVSADGDEATEPVLVANGLERVTDSATLAAKVAAFGGAVVSRDEADQLVQSLQVSAVTEPRPMHPMRSPWWLVAFVGCLGLEWWLRQTRPAAIHVTSPAR